LFERNEGDVAMTERTDDWRTIFRDLIDNSGWYEIDKVNVYQLTSHLEELYLQNQELKEQIEYLERELEYQKEYAMEQNERYG
jgi:sulfur relay (sulfurtransferase) DsrF/TusC family protein